MIKVVVFNPDAQFGPSLRQELQASRKARIVAELVDSEDLIPTVQRLTPDVVIICLHPEPDPLLTLTSRLSEACQDVRIFGIADSDDPQLILTSMRAGMCEFLTKPIDSKELQLALSKVAALKPPGAGKGRLLAMVRSTGGCGATFLAVNMACELVNSCEQSAVVVDLDFCGGQVATYLDLTPSFTLGDLAETSETLETQMLERIITRHTSGVAVIARPTPMAQGELLQNNQAEMLVSSTISVLIDMYDYVILDGLSPSRQSDLGLLRMADHILLVMNLLVPSVRNAHRILETMTGRHGLVPELPPRSAEYSEARLDPILLLINRLGRESSYLRIQDVEKTLNRKIFAQIPDDWRTVSRSINAGDPLQIYAPNSKTRLSLVDIARRLAGKTTANDSSEWSAASGRRTPGLFGRMLHRAAHPDHSSRKNHRRSLAGVVNGDTSNH